MRLDFSHRDSAFDFSARHFSAQDLARTAGPGAPMRRDAPFFFFETDLTAKLRRNIIILNESESQ
jgi:hypothetical protein